jgi:hypothetical protein
MCLFSFLFTSLHFYTGGFHCFLCANENKNWASSIGKREFIGCFHHCSTELYNGNVESSGKAEGSEALKCDGHFSADSRRKLGGAWTYFFGL